jgi:hypothetical protein
VYHHEQGFVRATQPAPTVRGPESKIVATALPAREVRPDDIIPMDDDFKDF